MYGLTQSVSMANKLLQKRLATYGFIPTSRTLELWRHETRLIQFAFVIDEFGVEYERKVATNYFLDSLNSHYEAATQD